MALDLAHGPFRNLAGTTPSCSDFGTQVFRPCSANGTLTPPSSSSGFGLAAPSFSFCGPLMAITRPILSLYGTASAPP